MKYAWLVLLSVVLISIESLGVLGNHLDEPTYRLTVIFFIAQSIMIFRLDHYNRPDIAAQIRMLNIGLRMLSALAFLIIMTYQIETYRAAFYIQFILLYLVFMIFEITLALTNLRRN